MYRQAVAVGSPSGSAPSTPACGTFSAAERSALIADAKAALKGKSLPNAKKTKATRVKAKAHRAKRTIHATSKKGGRS
jgi:hypothetical protein